MTSTRRRAARLVALLGAGGVLLQTGSCALDTLGTFVQSLALTYLYDVVNVIFRNLLNV